MNKFLVISYSGEDYSGQFFYDHVVAKDEHSAAARVEKVRPYVEHVEAIPVEELALMHRNLLRASPKKIAANLEEIRTGAE
jgi:hypothetical protein